MNVSNAFNSPNKQVYLQTIRRLCPSLATVLINTYMEPEESLLERREHQGRSISHICHVYMLVIVLFIRQLVLSVAQVWYADDACLWCWGRLITFEDGGMISAQEPQPRITSHMPINRPSLLITKGAHYFAASFPFAGLNVNNYVTSKNRPHWSAVIGTIEF